SEKNSIFGDVTLHPFYNLSMSAMLDSIAVDTITFMGDLCDSICEKKVSQWMTTLEACTMSTQDSIDVREQLLELCILGCDSVDFDGYLTLPAGVETSETYTSAQDILVSILGSESESCNAYLLSDFGLSLNMHSGIQTDTADTCACDKILIVNADFRAGNYPQGITSAEELFFHYYGYAPGVIMDLAVCGCMEAWWEEYPTENYNSTSYWGSSASSYLSANPVHVSSFANCQTCVSC